MGYIKRRTLWLFTLLFTLVISSCQNDGVEGVLYNEGYLNFAVGHDVNIDVSTKADPVIFAVTITNALGEIVGTYSDHTQMPEKVKLKAGKYKIKAENGRDLASAFASPYYVGETEFEILADKTTSSKVVCTLANVKVSVSFGDAIKNTMSSYVVSVTNEDGGTLVFNSDEIRSGYFKCSGKLTWNINMTNKNGVDFSLIRTVKDVMPREHYIFKFNIDENGDPNNGGASTDIELDESLNEQQHNIDIILGKKAKAIIEGSGFDIKIPLSVAFGESKACAVNITAAAQIYSFEIKHSSAHLVSIGIPYKFNLASSNQTVLDAVKSAGITWGEVSGAVRSSVDFGGLISKLPLGEYEFEISVLDFQNQLVSQKLIISVDAKVDVTTMGANAWGKFATLKGKWNTLEQPAGVGFVYKKKDAASWTTVLSSNIVAENKTFTATITGLTAESEYIFKAVSSGEEGAADTTFITESVAQLPNMNFDGWYKDGKHWLPRLDSESLFWDSGNRGANTLKEVNPTKPEETIIVSGKAARLGSTVAANVFAAGSIFSGQFVKAVLSPLGAELDFGRPYTSRPLQVKGYYRYQPGIIDKTGGNYGSLSGTQDSCSIYVLLTDWDGAFRVNTGKSQFVDIKNDPKIIAYGAFSASKVMDAYEEFTIDIEYRDTTRKPKYVVFVASASKYGDYFTGSTSSVLYIDEFEFIFDPAN